MRKIFFVLFLFVTIYSSAKEPLSERDFWVDKYLSVSYPLKTMQEGSPYGMRRDPFTGKGRMHSGVDLHAKYEDVYSMFDGYVQAVGSDARSGIYVILRHGNYTVSYCHLSQVNVRVHDIVFAGDVVAVSGSTGRSTGPHLHVTCKKNGKVINPDILFAIVDETRKIARESLALLRDDEEGYDDPDVIIKDRKDFLNAFSGYAIREQQRYGIPASVTLSQMALESGWGKSTLAKNARNFFGVRASAKWIKEGKPYYLIMENGRAMPYCMYNSAEESIEDHSRILMGKRYSRCWAFGDKDYHGWLVNIQQAGYAGTRYYALYCERLIRQNQLYLYDYKV